MPHRHTPPLLKTSSMPFCLPPFLQLTQGTLFVKYQLQAWLGWMASSPGSGGISLWICIAWLSPLVRLCRSMALPIFTLSPDTSFIAVWPNRHGCGAQGSPSFLLTCYITLMFFGSLEDCNLVVITTADMSCLSQLSPPQLSAQSVGAKRVMAWL